MLSTRYCPTALQDCGPAGSITGCIVSPNIDLLKTEPVVPQVVTGDRPFKKR